MLIRLDNADMALPFAEGRESHHFQPIMKQFVWMEHENQVQKLFYITEIAKHIFKRCEILGKIFLYVIVQTHKIWAEAQPTGILILKETSRGGVKEVSRAGGSFKFLIKILSCGTWAREIHRKINN